jgi:hypothetical protein
MAAAAVATAQLHKSSTDTQRKISQDQQISFHIKQLGKQLGTHLDIGDQSSVDYLRQPFDDRDKWADPLSLPGDFSEIHYVSKSLKSKNPANVILEVWVYKLAIHGGDDASETLIWQPRLLVLAQERLFILRKVAQGFPEIVDSIPLHEIDRCVQFTNSKIEKSRNGSLKKTGSRVLSSSGLHEDYEDNSYNTNERNRRMIDKYDLLLSSQTRKCLRITTSPDGFNDGRPYYFHFSRDSKLDVSRDSEVGEIGATDKLRVSMEEVRKLIDDMSKEQKKSVEFQVGLKKFQFALQRVWLSTAFNVLVLLLIVSNFVFTVRGMENVNPDNDAFFERVDLIYTILFALGRPPT